MLSAYEISSDLNYGMLLRVSSSERPMTQIGVLQSRGKTRKGQACTTEYQSPYELRASFHQLLLIRCIALVRYGPIVPLVGEHMC